MVPTTRANSRGSAKITKCELDFGCSRPTKSDLCSIITLRHANYNSLFLPLSSDDIQYSEAQDVTTQMSTPSSINLLPILINMHDYLYEKLIVMKDTRIKIINF